VEHVSTAVGNLTRADLTMRSQTHTTPGVSHSRHDS
jgi:hypothetical protein